MLDGRSPRAHPKEKALYRQAVEEALESCGVAAATFVGDSLRGEATARLPALGVLDWLSSVEVRA
jgi:hypothetical protein